MTNSPAGTPDWFGWANACISELVPVAALLDIRRRTNRPTGYPLALLVAAADLSLAAQLAVAKPGVSGGLLSAVPALAFMALVKLVFASSPATVARVADVADVTPVRVATPAPAARAVPLSPAAARSLAGPTVADNGRADDGRAADVTPPRRVATPRPKVTRQAAREAGATPASVAAALGVSVRTAQRHWPRPTTSPALALAAVTA